MARRTGQTLSPADRALIAAIALTIATGVAAKLLARA